MIGVMSFFLLISLLVPFSNPIKTMFNQDELIKQNHVYLNEIIKIDSKKFIQLAEIDALLAVLQSGEVGISFIVDIKAKVGQSLSTFGKMIDRSLEVTIASIFVVSLLSILLELSEYLSELLLVTILVLVCLFCFFYVVSSESIRKKFIGNKLLEVLILLFLSCHLLVPYSIHGASYLQHVIFSENIAEKNQNLSNLHESIYQGTQHISFKNRATNDFKKFEAIASDITKKIENSMTYNIEQLLHTFFIAIVIPIRIFAFLYYFVKKFLTRVCKQCIEEVILVSTMNANDEATTKSVDEKIKSPLHTEQFHQFSTMSRKRRNSRRRHQNLK